MSFDLLPEYPIDSHEWHEARRLTLGASEVAAVLGLSPWQSPLSVWRTKMGVPNQIDPETAWHGHAMEPVIAEWLTAFHPEVGLIEPGVSLRSVEYPWLSATPDRTVSPLRISASLDAFVEFVAGTNRDGWALAADAVPVELKTSRRGWDDGVPDYYRIQSIVQQGVMGAPFGWVAANFGSGAERYALYRIPFDAAVWEQITRITGEWWETYVVGEVAPEPSSSAEAVELWPGDPELTVEGSVELLDLWDAYGLMQAEQIEVGQQLDAIKLELQKAMQDATALTYQGRELFTWKPRKGAARFDATALKADLPDVHAKYIREGAPTRAFIRKTTKEVTK